VVSEPVEANPSATDGNEGGLVIRLKRGDGDVFEVTRVGYVRRNSKNPGRTFEEQRQIELDKAYTACETCSTIYKRSTYGSSRSRSRRHKPNSAICSERLIRSWRKPRSG
jgi:hypothetical protein